MDTPIALVICGKKFIVEKQILCRSNFFKTMFEDCTDSKEVIINNRSPYIFKHVLGYLISDKYPYPKKYEDELKYYLIDYDINKLYDPNRDIISLLSGLAIAEIVKANRNANIRY
jgi:hypothetical protein